VIVRDLGDSWQIVLQTDHAELAGSFAEAWGNTRFEPVRPPRVVVSAAARHDDGWAIWERAPSILAQNGSPKPRNFLDVQVLSHLAFYRAQIAAVTDDDEYAGMLIAMHGCGIYNGRYGTDPALKLTFAPLEREAVDGFVSEQERFMDRVMQERGISKEERWTNYKLVQIFDRLSLYFCMKDVVQGESAVLSPAPIAYENDEDAELRIEPDGPWRVTMDPFPFGSGPAEFTLLRRELPKRAWTDVDEFRRDFFDNPAEPISITISPA
jgi:Protein of unknown function (DUF3891)